MSGIDQNDLYTRLGKIEEGVTSLVRADERRAAKDEQQDKRIAKLEHFRSRFIGVAKTGAVLLAIAGVLVKLI